MIFTIAQCLSKMCVGVWIEKLKVVTKVKVNGGFKKGKDFMF